MSQQNVEIVRRFADLATGARDFDAAFQLAHEDVVFDWRDSRAPYSGLYQGRGECLAAWRVWLEAWDEWNPEVKEAIDVDPETVVVVTEIHARGKGSGVPVRAGGASVWRVRDGKIAYAKLFQSKAEALAGVSRPAT